MKKYNLIEIIQMAKDQDGPFEFFWSGYRYKVDDGVMRFLDQSSGRWEGSIGQLFPNDNVFTLPEPKPKEYKFYRHWYTYQKVGCVTDWALESWNQFNTGERSEYRELIHTEVRYVSKEGVRDE